jgi:hypothetical protein
MSRCCEFGSLQLVVGAGGPSNANSLVLWGCFVLGCLGWLLGLVAWFGFDRSSVPTLFGSLMTSYSGIADGSRNIRQIMRVEIAEIEV